MRKILVTMAAALCVSQAAFAEEVTPKDAVTDTPTVKADTVTTATPTPAPTPAPTPKAETAEKPAPKADYHSATWKGGNGSSWKLGYHKYGFEGYFGGCHYTGHAGPHGYHLDKVC